MPHAVTAGQQDIPGRNCEIMGCGGGSLSVPRHPTRMFECGMVVGLSLRQLSAVYQRLNVGVVTGAVEEPTTLEMVDARIPGVHPVAVAPRGLMRNAAMVLCGSCSAEMAVSRMTMCASSTMVLSMAAGSSVSGVALKSWRAVIMTWSDALRPPLRPPMPSATTPARSRCDGCERSRTPDPAGTPVSFVDTGEAIRRNALVILKIVVRAERCRSF